ncbi:putative pectinesterase/pectinesterase inhibitor 24 [Primulina huaijiensis]|uniref:putative pectinesterase/pectinesterase inhibitor 24 n=1 Tax=Primulina huaijiensis TaxID=1492673 RepID=UPI003CC79BF5
MAYYNGNLAFLLLITMLFCVTATEDESAECSKINSVEEICTLTMFPNSCYNSLVMNLAPNVTTQPEIIYMKSVQVTMAEVSRTTRDFSENGTLQKLVVRKSKDKEPALSAMGICRELLSLAMDNVNKSSSSNDGSSLEKISYENIRSWLSAAATDLQTCEDGFEDLSKEVRNIAAVKLKNSTEYTSNTLAIATEIGKCEKATREHLQTANSNARK